MSQSTRQLGGPLCSSRGQQRGRQVLGAIAAIGMQAVGMMQLGAGADLQAVAQHCSLGRWVMFGFLLYARARTIPNNPWYFFVALTGVDMDRIDRQISMHRSTDRNQTFTVWIGFGQEEVHRRFGKHIYG
jgi:hypothetical protein